MKRLRLILAALCFVSLAMSQTETAKPAPTEPGKFYRLDFTVRELEAGKVVNSRDYSTSMSTNRPNERPSNVSIRSGDRVPIPSDYLNLGTNIDCSDLRQQGDHLSLRVKTEITSQVKVEGGTMPLLRQTQWEADVLIPIRKATVVFSSDSPTSNGRMQLEITAAPMN